MIAPEYTRDCESALSVLTTGLQQLDLTLSQRQCDQFVSYCAELMTANDVINLTAVRSADGIMRTLCLDSLTISPAIRDSTDLNVDGDLRVIDVGSGAGIPGIPLKIYHPRWSLTCVESTSKKARMIRQFIQSLNISDAHVLPLRAEDAAKQTEWRERMDVCIARAVASLASLIELCAPFVRVGGYLVFPKSGDVTAEIAAGEAAAQAMRVSIRNEVTIPEDLGLGKSRAIVVYQKIAPTPPDYPRRVGLATSQPIGIQNPARAEARPRAPRER